MDGIGMMNIYCPPLTRFPTAIDDIIMLISGLGYALEAIYILLSCR
jgi:hypothetical protein